MLIKSGVTRCTLSMALYIAVPYVPVPVTRGALVAHRYTYICDFSLQKLAAPKDLY